MTLRTSGMHPPHPVPALVFFLRSPIEVQSPILMLFTISPFETFLRYQLAKTDCAVVDLYSRGSYKLGHRHQGRHRCPLPFWHR
jgi:hypothetical protein